MVVNAPFLYGPLLLFLGGARKRNPFGKALDASAVLGLAALSVAPHQEPRFLLPVLLPLVKAIEFATELEGQPTAAAMLDALRSRNRGDGTMAVILDVAGMTIGRHINKDFIWFVTA